MRRPAIAWLEMAWGRGVREAGLAFIIATGVLLFLTAWDPALIAPGLSYAGAGWELAIEGLVPARRATGRGVGVRAQFHLSLDFVAAETIGRPLFSAP